MRIVFHNIGKGFVIWQGRKATNCPPPDTMPMDHNKDQDGKMALKSIPKVQWWHSYIGGNQQLPD